VNQLKTILLKFLSQKKGETVIDCGAHIGKYTILASKLVGPKGKVIAIEPCPENYRILMSNLKLNKCKNVYPINAAVWEKNKKVRLFLADISSKHSMRIKSKNFIDVRGIRLDSLFKNLKLKKVDWIKIDVEGVEIETVKSLGKDLEKVKNIIIETKKKSILNFLRDNGFFIRKIEEKNYFCSNLFHHNN
jgi:FkbM family methyltransferase